MTSEQLNFEAERPVDRRPESMSEIYALGSQAKELRRQYEQDPELYDQSVSKPFLNNEGSIDTGLTTVEGNMNRRAFVVLKAPGCNTRRSFAEKGGCANCGFCTFSEHYSTGGAPVSPEQYERQINYALDRPEVQETEILELFNAGSFFNDNEISPEAREKILKSIAAKTTEGKILTVEARFSDLAGDQIDKVDEALASLNSDGKIRNLEVAFGLETTDEMIGKSIGKQVSEEQLEQTMSALAERDVRPFMYVLVKPGLMSEQQALEMGIETVKKVAKTADKIKIPSKVKPHLSISGVRVYTGSQLHAHPGYEATKLWTIAETVKRLANDPSKPFDHVSMHVGLSDEDIPIAEGGSPRNCGQCDPKIIQALEHFNQSMDTERLNQELAEAEQCPCHQQWEEELRNVPVERLSAIPEQQNEQLDQVMDVEGAAWPEGTRATKDKFESRAKVYPEGFFLAYEAGRVVGVSTSEVFSYSEDSDIQSWENITNNGFITSSQTESGTPTGHQEQGNALYVVSLGVDPAVRNRNIGSILIRRQQELATAKGLQYVVLGARLPGYAEAKQENPELTAEEYASSARADGSPRDDEIRFYSRNGFRISEVKANYMEDDPESLNYGVVMIWEKPKK